jgi:hypothetical protein
MNCEEIKKEDKVWIEYMRIGVRFKRHAAVNRLTKTQIIIGDNRYDRKSGYAVGPFSSCDRIIGTASYAEIAAFDKAQAKEAKREAKLDKEEKELYKLFCLRGNIEFSRRGTVYHLNFFRLKASQVRAIAWALKAC